MMRMPLGPVGNVLGVTLTLEDGTTQTIHDGDYIVLSSDDVYVIRMPNVRLRAVRPVEIVYTAGFTELPKALRQAMLLNRYTYSTNREAVVTGNVAAAEVPVAARTLLNQYKRWWC